MLFQAGELHSQRNMALIAAKARRPQGSVLEEIVDCLRLMLGTAFAYAWEQRH